MPKQRTVVITGARSGIGRAFALEEQKRGSLVIAIDKGHDVHNVLKPDPKNSQGRIISIAVDVTDFRSLQRNAEFVKGVNGGVDLLVMSAGITQTKIGQVSNDEFARIRRVNVEGTKNTFYSFEYAMRDKGIYLFLSSDLITHAETDMPAYVDSKRRIAEFAELQSRRSQNLRILTLLPGPVDTPLFRANKTYQDLRRIAQNVGIMTPEGFVGVVLDEILQDANAYPNGSQIRVYPGEVKKIN